MDIDDLKRWCECVRKRVVFIWWVHIWCVLVLGGGAFTDAGGVGCWW